MHWLLILATDGTPMVQFDASAIMAALSTVGSVGFAVWYAWYVTTVSIPKLLEAHRTERVEMLERFDATMHELLAEMKEQRALYGAWKDK